MPVKAILKTYLIKRAGFVEEALYYSKENTAELGYLKLMI